MARTERLQSSTDADGMLREAPCDQARVTTEDLLAYGDATRVADALSTQDVFEYWRASPYHPLAVARRQAYPFPA